MRQKNRHFALLLVSLLILILLTSACTRSLPSTDIYLPGHSPENITIHGTISDMHYMDCPCFTLVTETGNTTIWYNLLVGPDGTRQPGIAINNLSDGEPVWVTGSPQAWGKFWAYAISTTSP